MCLSGSGFLESDYVNSGIVEFLLDDTMSCFVFVKGEGVCCCYSKYNRCGGRCGFVCLLLFDWAAVLVECVIL